MTCALKESEIRGDPAFDYFGVCLAAFVLVQGIHFYIDHRQKKMYAIRTVDPYIADSIDKDEFEKA